MKNYLNNLVNEYNESVNNLPYDYKVNKFYYTNGGIATTHVEKIGVGNVMTEKDIEDMIDVPLHPEPESMQCLHLPKHIIYRKRNCPHCYAD